MSETQGNLGLDEIRTGPTARGLVIGIDAANLRKGGGRTHLIELLRTARPIDHGVAQVVVWGARETLDLLEDREWLIKCRPQALESGLLKRTLWQRFRLAAAARRQHCDLLFVPGGSYAGNFHPVVAMSQNLLPFEWRELRRYGISLFTLKLLVLRLTQTRSLQSADGVIFLTSYAKDRVEHVTGALAHSVIIRHGLNSRFFRPPKTQQSINAYTFDRPYRVIYVSIITQYKHQWHVVEAVATLRSKGFPVALDLVGPAYSPALEKLNATIKLYDPHDEWVRHHGDVPYSELHDLYAQADLGLFASSCENMPNILLETMAAGLPVACSDQGPMPEILGDTGVYFDPERPGDIARALRELIDSPALRAQKAKASYSASLAFDWKCCADETFSFLARIAADSR